MAPKPIRRRQHHPRLTRPSLKPCLILKRDYGQLGNRLHTHANALAFALEHDLDLLNLSFSEQAKHFALHDRQPADRHLPGSPLIRNLLRLPKFPALLQRLALSDRHLAKFGSKVRALLREDEQALTEQELEHALRRSSRPRFLLLRAWDLRCPQALEKHAPEIRRRLTPTKRTRDAVTRLLADLPPRDVLVGLHARRGDYATWQDGLHHHSWEQYADWLRQTHALLLQAGHQPAYLLCSDESPPPDAFYPLPVAIEPRSLMTDLHALSTCNLLLGPPSSFGSWAAFYGNVPRLCLQPDAPVTTLPPIRDPLP